MPLNKIFEVRILTSIEEFQVFFDEFFPLRFGPSSYLIENQPMNLLYEFCVTKSRFIKNLEFPPAYTNACALLHKPESDRILGGIINCESTTETELLVEAFTNNDFAQKELIQLYQFIHGHFTIEYEEFFFIDECTWDDDDDFFDRIESTTSGGRKDKAIEDLPIKDIYKLVLRLWQANYSTKDIGADPRVNMEPSSVTNLLSKLRKLFGTDLVPMDVDRRESHKRVIT